MVDEGIHEQYTKDEVVFILDNIIEAISFTKGEEW